MGKKLPLYFLKEYVFWLLFFAISRSVFLIYNLDEIKSLGLGEVLSVYWHAVYLDTSMASYLLAIPFFLFLLYSLFEKRIFLKINTIYVSVFIVLFTIITIAELEIYNEWSSKFTYKALKYLDQPSEVINSTRTSFLIGGILTITIISWAFIYLHKRICRKENLIRGKSYITSALFFLITPCLLALGIRGGVQQIPIQQSDVYFSKHNILNLAAINSLWNLLSSINENKKSLEGNPYKYYPMAEAEQQVKELFAVPKDTTISILKTSKPNIVMVVLESWSGDLIKSLGGYDSVASNLEKLIPEGVFFENIYASGNLSDQGMAAIFSAFPAQPSVSIISQPSKYVHLPCINAELKQKGYSTSFLFGGQLSYGNIKAYMYFNNFDRILEGENFDDDIPRGKLGVHDEYLYARQLKELKNEKEPFFAAMFTLSSHSPFDMPMKKEVLSWGGDENKYINSVVYSDEQLYKFVQNAKKEKWFNNTLFIFVPDHSHRSPKHYDVNQPEYRHIPMLFWGNVIKDEYKGYKHKKLCSQIDLASTLLHQLGAPTERYRWSKNLFNPYTPEFAYFETNDGFGWIRPNNEYLVYSHVMKRYDRENCSSPEVKSRLEKEGKSFLEVMFEEYTNY